MKIIETIRHLVDQAVTAQEMAERQRLHFHTISNSSAETLHGPYTTFFQKMKTLGLQASVVLELDACGYYQVRQSPTLYAELRKPEVRNCYIQLLTYLVYLTFRLEKDGQPAEAAQLHRVIENVADWYGFVIPYYQLSYTDTQHHFTLNHAVGTEDMGNLVLELLPAQRTYVDELFTHPLDNARNG